ncbi:hypothetical protein ES703_109776 [subsurface metagenome]
MKFVTPIVAILAIVGLEVYALSQGVNGAILGWVFVIIGGLGGYELKILRDKIGKKK